MRKDQIFSLKEKKKSERTKYKKIIRRIDKMAKVNAFLSVITL